MTPNSQMGFSNTDGLSNMGGRGGGSNGIFPRGPSGPPPSMNQPVYENTMKVDIQVPSDKACLGHIIGPKGSFIGEMQRSSNCQIKIDKEHKEGTNIAERNVAVSGSNMVQICHAIELINTKVDEWRRNLTNNGSGNISNNSSYKGPEAPKPYRDESLNNGVALGYASQYPKSQQSYNVGTGSGLGMAGTGLGMGSNIGMLGQSQGYNMGPGQGQGYIQGQGQGRY